MELYALILIFGIYQISQVFENKIAKVHVFGRELFVLIRTQRFW
jgi:hypothetical protein